MTSAQHFHLLMACVYVVVSQLTPATAWSDTLPSGAVARCGSNRLWVGDWIRRIAVSPNGRTIATVRYISSRREGVADKSKLEIWDAVHGNVKSILYEGEQSPGRILFSPDGKYLAVSMYPGDLCLYQLSNGRRLWSTRIADERHSDFRLAFFRKGETIVACRPEDAACISLFDSSSGRQRTISTNQRLSTVLDIQIHPDNAHVILATPESLLTINSVNSAEHSIKVEYNRPAIAANLSMDGALVGFLYDKYIHVYETIGGRRLTARGLMYPCEADDRELPYPVVAFSADSKLLAVPVLESGAVDLINWQTGGILYRLRGIDGSIHALAMAASANVLVVGAERRIHVLHTDTKTENPLTNCHDDIIAATISECGTTVVTTGSNSVRVWNADDGRLRFVLPGIRNGVVNPAGTAIVGLRDRDRLQIWSTDKGEQTGEEKLRTWVQPSDRRGAVEDDGRKENVGLLAVSGFGEDYVYLVDGRHLFFWSRDTDQYRHALPVGNVRDRILAISGDGRKLALAGGYTIWVYDVKAAARIGNVGEKGFDIGALTISGDGMCVAAMCYRSEDPGRGGIYIDIWSIVDRKRLYRLDVTASCQAVNSLIQNKSTPLSFSADGAVLAVGTDDGRVMLIALKTGMGTFTRVGHRAPVVALDCSSRKRRLVSGSYDGTALVWDLDQLLAPAESKARDDPAVRKADQ
jgi:WD40 repeat protein